MGRLESINTSRGGVPKISVFEALVTETGVDGDHQAHLQLHGGPDRAVVIFSLDVIRRLQLEGHPIAPGSTGENLTVSGLDWTLVVPGSRLAIGEVELEITRYTNPCETIRCSFVGEDSSRIYQRHHPGWSRVCARVRQGGLIRMGDPVELVNAPSSAAAPADRQSPA